MASSAPPTAKSATSVREALLSYRPPRAAATASIGAASTGTSSSLLSATGRGPLAASGVDAARAVGGGDGRHRFSELLLEHGERHLQDWAVNASSSPLLPTNRNKKTNKKAATAPSASMGSIDGRLRLCSRSVVFEPSDPTRGVIRCPFRWMEGVPCPSASPSVGGGEKGGSGRREYHRMTSSSVSEDGLSGDRRRSGGGGAMAATIKCDRHLIVRSSRHAVGPFESVEVKVEFCFTFLHSAPTKFFELSRTLFGMEKNRSKNGSGTGGGHHHQTQKQQRLDDILRPMLDRPFDPANFVDAREEPLTANLRCTIKTLLLSRPGCSIVTRQHLYFQPASGVFSSHAGRASCWPTSGIVATARRYDGLRDSALELFFVDGSSILLAFERPAERERVLKLLPRRGCPCHTDRSFVVQAAREWSSGALSNFEYLLALNSAAGRTFHDLSRYPVFPWVIADYTSRKLDLSSSATYRDLSKPVGALNEERLAYFRKRLKGMHDMEHPFLYGTHYSAPGYVLYYLVRIMPEHMLCLQNGKFDAPDRMFHSLDHCYSSVLTNPADVKELIPEFFDTSSGFDFLINSRCLQLGTTQTGDRVHDVMLPPWAKSPRDFLKKNRKALESDICTQMLPRWIDLVFGDISRGESAMQASNLFHRTAYLGPADLDRMKSVEERAQAELHATEFGLCCDQLFCAPHPPRTEVLGESNFVLRDFGRSLSDDDAGNEHNNAPATSGKGLQQLEQPWELLDSPLKMGVSSEDTMNGDHNLVSGSRNVTESSSSWSNIPEVQSSVNAVEHISDEGGSLSALQKHPSAIRSADGIRKGEVDRRRFFNDINKNLSLSGSGDTPHGRGNDKFGVPSRVSTRNGPPAGVVLSANSPSENILSTNLNTSPFEQEWDLNPITSKVMHGDSVSGCSLLLQEGAPNQSYLTTTSLDGTLMVHTLPPLHGNYDQNEQTRMSPTQTRAPAISRLPYLYRSGERASSSLQTKINPFRSHAASDPLACLAQTSDSHGGHIIFAGGHDDVVLAYGINSACALASVYSHRDAVTGIDIIQRAPSSEKSAHMMITGSWDACVKIWSVSIAEGEAVSINREPILELFDADSSIVCVTAIDVLKAGIAIAAGCADGSFVVWLFRNDGAKEVIHKEPPKRGGGPCASVKWKPTSIDGTNLLFVGFATGKVASFVLENGGVRPISKLSIGSPVQCMSLLNGVLLAGCADGGLRLVHVGSDGSFDANPHMWKAVNGESSPGLSSLCAAPIGTSRNPERYACATGGDDGSVTLFELKKKSA